jgi:hypothetical protein
LTLLNLEFQMLKNIIMTKNQLYLYDLPSYNLKSSFDHLDIIQYDHNDKDIANIKKEHPDVMIREMLTMDLVNNINKKMMDLYLNSQI